MSCIDEEEIHDWVVKSRAKQGLPPKVEDPAVLARVRVLLGTPIPSDGGSRAGIRQKRSQASDVSVEAALQSVAKAAQGLRRAERQLEKAVQRARARGATWTAIGHVLGISRQGAHFRFRSGSSSRDA